MKFTLYKSTPNYDVFRQKAFSCTCTEEQALAMVRPIVDTTAYLMAVETSEAMPTLDAIRVSMIEARILIAARLSVFFKRTITEQEITNLSASVYGHSGYFEIHGAYTREATLETRRQRYPFRLALHGLTHRTTIIKLLQSHGPEGAADIGLKV